MKYNLAVSNMGCNFIKVTDRENNIDICLDIKRQDITIEQIHDIVKALNNKTEIYNKVKEIQSLIFKDDDRMDQDTLFELQEKIALLTLQVAQKEGKTEDLIKSFKWLYDVK